MWKWINTDVQQYTQGSEYAYEQDSEKKWRKPRAALLVYAILWHQIDTAWLIYNDF